MLWSAIDLDAGLWTKAFKFRKRKLTEINQHPQLVPLAPMAIAILRKLKDYHERELARKNATYGARGTGKNSVAGRVSTSRIGSFRVERTQRSPWPTSSGKRTP
jgi:hypothetical protein